MGGLLSVEELDRVLLVGAAVLLVAIVAVRLSTRTGLPSLLIYLGLGLALGTDGLGIEFSDVELTRTLGYAALIVILAEGGLTTRWSTIRPVVPVAVALATVGVGVSVGVTALVAHAAFDMEWRHALLLGAIVSSTDAAAVFSVLRRLPLSQRVVGALEAESGFNDAPVVILVSALSMPGEPGSLWQLLGMLVFELAVGAVVGLAVGRVGAATLRRVALPASGLYPLAVFGLIVGAYAAAALLHGSGFLATYLAALVLGNARLPHGPATRGFAEGLAWLAQIGLFILLGLLATPHDMGSALLPALVIGTALLLLARPLSVLVSVLPFRMPWREQAILSWAGLRGAVPIVLATVPLVTGVERAGQLFNIVFVLVVVFTLVQGPTLPWLARLLGFGHGLDAHDLGVESAPLEHLGAHLLEVRVPDDSRLHGVEIFELRLPRGAAVTLVVRDGQSFVPTPTTTLRHGDELLVVTTEEVREETERRLRAVSRGGKLARWFGEHG
ncbi:potassium transporter [Carbonactinospora thermoautotrophica]|uniref:Potassium transporter n=1 Tax=Carbonactinospora thermoautotrophica TaxID=1469144 RepID=A0A132NEF0_9ACTN|nr:potassium transporter [Carbonactinospora thermoautotrophica]KWX08504.1 potassium transporter [Carbonactinospora thermoautotrophica]